MSLLSFVAAPFRLGAAIGGAVLGTAAGIAESAIGLGVGLAMLPFRAIGSVFSGGPDTPVMTHASEPPMIHRHHFDRHGGYSHEAAPMFPQSDQGPVRGFNTMAMDTMQHSHEPGLVVQAPVFRHHFRPGGMG